mgnify:CR=1 FL=1
MTTTTTSQPQSFAQKLRAELDHRTTPGTPWGARTVARLVVAKSPARDLEQTRRAVIRWLAGATPTQANRDEVTDALGMERGSLDPDEEDDPVVSYRARRERKMNDALAEGRLDDALRHFTALAGRRK